MNKLKRLKLKGAMSLEYILVIIVVVLVALGGMKLFGTQVGDTINDSKDAVQSATSSIFAQTGGSGSGSGSGGSEKENVGALYIPTPSTGRFELYTQAQYNNTTNDTGHPLVPYTGEAYYYDFTLPSDSGLCSYFSTGDEITYIAVATPYGTNEYGYYESGDAPWWVDDGKTASQLTVGDLYITDAEAGTGYTVSDVQTKSGTLDASGITLYRQITLNDNGGDKGLTKAADIPVGEAGNYTLYEGRAYKFEINGKTIYNIMDRQYYVRINMDGSFTEFYSYDDRSSMYPAGGTYYGYPIEESQWYNGTEVDHY